MTYGTKQHDESDPKPIRKSLWWIALAPSIWAIHFLACYLTVAIWCEKVSSYGSDRLLWLICIYSVVAIAGIAIVGWLSFRNFRRHDPPVPYDFDDPHDRTNFLGFTAFLLALLSGIATLFTMLVFLFVRSCD